MARIEEIVDNNLTTDACPSPPRTDDTENKKIIDDTIGNEESKNSNYIPGKAKTKKNQKRRNKNSESTTIVISNSNHVQFGHKYIFNVLKQDKCDTKSDNILTDDIKKLLQSEEYVSLEDIFLLSTHIGEGWRHVGRKLNYSEGEIDQIYESSIHSGLKEVIYKMLLSWIQNEPCKATIGKLSEALLQSNQKEAMNKWAESKK